MIHHSIRFAFFGTPEPAVDILETLSVAGYAPALIVTNPDKPKGRTLKLAPPPVKVWAVNHNIPVLQPVAPTDPDFLHTLKAKSYQLFIVVAFGSILPKELLEMPKRGALNVHYSLLPKYRGASPVESQILRDDRETGISILLLDDRMDHGPLIAQEKVPLTDWPPTAVELRKKLGEAAGELLVGIIPSWVADTIQATPQDESMATYTRKFSAKDREIRLEEDGYKNYLKIQALSARGTHFFTEKSGKKLRVGIKRAEWKDEQLIIKRVVPEGRKEMSYEEFLRGFNRNLS